MFRKTYISIDMTWEFHKSRWWYCLTTVYIFYQHQTQDIQTKITNWVNWPFVFSNMSSLLLSYSILGDIMSAMPLWSIDPIHSFTFVPISDRLVLTLSGDANICSSLSSQYKNKVLLTFNISLVNYNIMIYLLSTHIKIIITYFALLVFCISYIFTELPIKNLNTKTEHGRTKYTLWL